MKNSKVSQCGLIGLGNMGLPMVGCLIRAGLHPIVYDARPDRMNVPELEGAKGARSIKELAQACDVVSIVVAPESQVVELLTSEDGLLAHMGQGSTVLVHSSARPSTVIELARLASEHHVDLVDAAVSGGAPAAQIGELELMMGGPDEVIGRCQPVLDALGTTLRLGPLGSGMVMKIVNNIMFSGTLYLTFEAFKLAAEFGIEESVVREISLKGSGRSWALEQVERLNEMILSWSEGPGQFDVGTEVQWAAVTTAQERGLDLPLVGVLAAVQHSVLRERYDLLKSRS